MKRIQILLVALIFVLPLCAQTRQWSELEQGNAAYRDGRYASAEEHYLRLLQQDPENAIAHYNLGLAYLEQQNTEAALQSFSDVVRLSRSDDLKASAWHNIGVIHEGLALVDDAQRMDLLRKAIDAYKESLRVNPTDDETRYNLALCQQQLRNDNQNEQQQQQPQQEEQQPQDEPQQQQDPTQQLMNLAQRAEDDTRKKINEARTQQHGLDKNW